MIPTLLMMVFTAMGNVWPTPFYRYYNRRRVDHFYTTDWNELGSGRYGWAYDSIECLIYSSQVPDTIPLYRYWGKNDHFYTTNRKEVGTAARGKIVLGGYRSQGIAGYCYSKEHGPETLPLHRLSKTRGRDHFYTTNKSESVAAEYGYRYEGIECYVLHWP